ncbi:MAG: tRNA(Ile)-lysidine synthetase [Verrucomicrobia bacterium]|nr:tRNA(Ile)-lysidine synthetase [Verrucomicrobiota bacterium]
MTRSSARASGRVSWAHCASKLAEALPRARLHPAVVAWAESASPRKTWAIAFSGGADSLCLLLLLWAHWPTRRRHLCALHFNHRLRGVESRRDAEFCRKACRGLGIKLIEGEWSDAHAGASEAEARAARHMFFARHSRALWSGHQQDDIAETFFMRLARGSGTGGLSAPRPIHAMPAGRTHVRPLLTVSKAQILAALRAAGATWREDSTNSGRYYFRNRIRRDVLPAWEQAAQRDALAGAARSRELLEDDDSALEAWLAEIEPMAKDGSLNLKRIHGKPRALVRRALHRWLLAQRRTFHLSRQAFDSLLGSVMRGSPTRQSLGAESFAVIEKSRLRFVARGKYTQDFHPSAN